ncbi:hypothetical protein MS3_00009380 [Schistosoma haematobium]|uniref:Uncharacterized protein n=1 Tax=Schistosoma haematobium TaxID=6185 RepID=A0A6A5DLJ7_SCHHA|nr:hypothetical protein MS3_00009380 [Schistosoma haematobium]KAH9580890.1 hypothetical protein MS3_00009380 [Schistosoma haematobium]
MSLFRRFFSCTSTDNYPFSYTTNLVQENTKKFPSNSNNICIICHESVITCLNNQSIKKQKYLSSITKNKQLSPLTTEENQNIQTKQPGTMSVCISCTDILDNNKNPQLSDNKMLDVTTSSYQYNLTHPYTTNIITTNPTTTLPISTVKTCISMNDTTEKSISLQCSKFITRWITHCPFQWNIKSSNQQKTIINNNNNNWQTTTAATTTIISNNPIDPIYTQSTYQQDLLNSTNKTIQTNNNDENIHEFIEECVIPIPVFNLFLYLAQEGVYAKDLFRRPGNIAQIKHILQRFASDQMIDWKDYNIHTVATVAKRVLFNIPNGLIGLKGEKQLLRTALLTQQPLNDNNQLKTICKTSIIHHHDTSNLEIDNNTENLLLELAESTNTSPLISVLDETNLNDNNKNVYYTNKEYTEQFNDVIRRAIVITNIDTTQQSNTVNLLFSYGSIKQIYQLTPVDIERVQVFQNILKDLTIAHRQLTIMIFGILHQLVFNMAFNTANQNHGLENDNDELPNIPLLKLAEGVVKSVAGSMFHSCASSILLINQTTQVLQSLVICFPVVDKQFTQFYWDILDNRYKLKKSKSNHFPGVKMNITKSGNTTRSESCSFMIYPKSAYSTRLINAAGRLFCLKNSSPTNITVNNNNVNDVQTSPPTSITSSVKHFCFPLKDSTRQLQKSKQYLSIHREASIESSFYQNTNETNNQNKQTETIIDQPVDVSLVSFTDSSECNKRTKCKDVKFSSYSKVNVHNELDNHITNEMNTNFYSNPINLRRNQSRYRSLRRRQMENLTKRAEWFLQPTILPKLTFTLNQFNDNNDTNTSMSTISLLNIQDKMNNTMTNHNSNMIQVVHPRILFTSSTSDLLIPSNYDHLDTTYCRQPYDETLLDHKKINPTHLYPSYNYGHSFNSLLNHSLLSTTSSSSSNYYVISQSNQLYSSQLNQQNHTINSLLIPGLSSEENNTSTHSFLYYNIPKYSLSYHHDYDHINKHDRLQSTSYDNFHILSYSSNHNIHENNNINLIDNCNITPTNISSISNTNYTNSTNLSFNVKNELCHNNNNKLTSSISGLDIIKKSNMVYSDWSIDRPIKNELLNRYRPRSHSISNNSSSSRRHSNNVTKLK